MATKRNAVAAPQFDRAELRELACCYARAAMDELIERELGAGYEPKAVKSKATRKKR
jgi:hypothetical protein